MASGERLVLNMLPSQHLECGDKLISGGLQRWSDRSARAEHAHRAVQALSTAQFPLESCFKAGGDCSGVPSGAMKSGPAVSQWTWLTFLLILGGEENSDH